MATTTIAFGVAFIIVGLMGYFGTGMVSVTALISAAFGLLFVILGVLARNPGKRRHAMHAAALVGLLAVLGTARAFSKIGPLLAGEPVDRPNAVIAQTVMAVLALVFVFTLHQIVR